MTLNKLYIPLTSISTCRMRTTNTFAGQSLGLKDAMCEEEPLSNSAGHTWDTQEMVGGYKTKTSHDFLQILIRGYASKNIRNMKMILNAWKSKAMQACWLIKTNIGSGVATSSKCGRRGWPSCVERHLVEEEQSTNGVNRKIDEKRKTTRIKTAPSPLHYNSSLRARTKWPHM